MFKTYSAEEYLAIDIANNFSSELEKSNFEDRILWFNDHKIQLNNLVDKAENPALFYAGITAFKDHIRGRAIGYPIRLDACSSGIQILACLTNCVKSATLCGLNNNNRVDAYTTLYKKIDTKGIYSREAVKKAIMTAFYNSKNTPKRVFEEKTEEFFNMLSVEVPGPWNFNEFVKVLWDPEAKYHSWCLPNNFHVKIPVITKTEEVFNFGNLDYKILKSVNLPNENYRSLSPNITHSIDAYICHEIQMRSKININQLLYVTDCFGLSNRSIKRGKDLLVKQLVNHYEKSNLLSARVINFIDAENIGLVPIEPLANLINSLPNQTFNVLSNHDCFGVHPNYGNDLRKTYSNILEEIANSNLLEYISNQITGRTYNIKYPKVLGNLIKNTNYALS